MYSNIQDCDEGLHTLLPVLIVHQFRILVFNFWEPLHFLDRGYGFQTWETSPVYAIRSYAYALLHLLPAKIPFWILGPEKVIKPLRFICVDCGVLKYPETCILCSSHIPRCGMYFMRSKTLSYGS